MVERILKLEPALVTGLVSAVLALLIAFNVNVSDDQGKAILGVTGVALALVQALVVRSQVVPVAKVVAEEDEATEPDLSAGQ